MAIPKQSQRWSDGSDEVVVDRARPDPLQRRRSFRAALVAKPVSWLACSMMSNEADKEGLDAWNMPTQNATQNQVQNESQTLFRDESMQVETASTMMALANHSSQAVTSTSAGRSVVLEADK
jgi:hypothetical protein